MERETEGRTGCLTLGHLIFDRCRRALAYCVWRFGLDCERVLGKGSLHGDRRDPYGGLVHQNAIPILLVDSSCAVKIIKLPDVIMQYMT